MTSSESWCPLAVWCQPMAPSSSLTNSDRAAGTDNHCGLLWHGDRGDIQSGKHGAVSPVLKQTTTRVHGLDNARRPQMFCCMNKICNLLKMFSLFFWFVVYLDSIFSQLLTHDKVSGQSDVWLHQSNRALVSFVCFTFYPAWGALVANTSCTLIGQLTTTLASHWLIRSGAGIFWTLLGISINILPASTPQDISCILHTQD